MVSLPAPKIYKRFKHRFRLPVVCSFLIVLTACSTQKNTWLSRHYQELNTRYNVYFNASEAYLSGARQLSENSKPDFSKLLNVFDVSNITQAKSTASSMNKAIVKCEKAIKLHSIRVKPAKKPTSKSKPSQKRFYEQEEFNPFMDEVFMLMARAQFTKADFESAAATCGYIVRHFPENRERCDEASILLARAYTELGWYMDAERVLNELNRDNLTTAFVAEYSAANAALYLRRKKLSEALPYLEIATREAKKAKDKQRWTFLLAQCQQQMGLRDRAFKTYGSIPAMNPPYEMELNARIRQTEVFPDMDIRTPLKKLEKLQKSRKNATYQDQILYAMGNLYLTSGDTVKALDCYHASLKKESASVVQKKKTLVTLGNLYFDAENFINAEPCYAQALEMLTDEDANKPIITVRSERLKMLVPFLTAIREEDSLQSLAKLPEIERIAIIDNRIAEVREQAQKDAEMQKQAPSALSNQASNQNVSGSPMNAPIGTDKGNWYFYNPASVKAGLSDFLNKWNNRALADNWRLRSRVEASVSTTNNEAVKSKPDSLTKRTKRGTGANANNATAEVDLEGSDDPLNRNYYLKNIPLSIDAVDSSNRKISDALLNSGIIFWEQLENNPRAIRSFQRLEVSFPSDKRLDKVWYVLYLLHKKSGNNAEAENARLRLVTNFPESSYAQRLKMPDYVERMKEMSRKQEGLYELTFNAFEQRESDSLKTRKDRLLSRYPYTPLKPRLLFLEAIEDARTGKADDFHNKLVQIRDSFPESDLMPKIKELLDFWNEGRRPVPTSGFSYQPSASDSLTASAKREKKDSATFEFLPEETHYLALAFDTSRVKVNRLQFDVALYNFTNYLVRDYDLTVGNIGKMNVLLIGTFENATDVLRYLSYLNFNGQTPEANYPGLHPVVVSETNLKLLQDGADIKDYDAFFNKHYTSIKTTF